MHNKMNEVQTKDWAKMQAYLEWNKKTYEHSIKAMQKHSEYDFHKMFMEDPFLFVFFVRIHEKADSGYDIEKFWNLHYQAYQHLKNDRLSDIDMTAQKLQLVRDFEAKLAGPCLISKTDLEESMTVKIKRNEKSVHFDYHEVLDLIEKQYKISVRGIFDNLKYQSQKDIFSKYFSIDIYNQASNVSPVDSVEANYISIIRDFIGDQFEYIDFWHYMLATDFSNISNGSISTMWPIENQEDDAISLESIINTKDQLKKYFSTKVKQVFFKELSQLEEVETYKGIEFLIEW